VLDWPPADPPAQGAPPAAPAATFTVTVPKPPVPKVTACTPGVGRAGSKVTLRGTDLGRAGMVTLGGVRAAFTVVSNTQVTVIVPRGVRVGQFKVTTPGGTATCATAFYVR
jgi:hypothetical protein